LSFFSQTGNSQTVKSKSNLNSQLTPVADEKSCKEKFDKGLLCPQKCLGEMRTTRECCECLKSDGACSQLDCSEATYRAVTTALKAQASARTLSQPLKVASTCSGPCNFLTGWLVCNDMTTPKKTCHCSGILSGSCKD
jgi:hypothetical protein